ncbi:hypothetical protein [Sedimentibacter saalensis]|uniref:Uncharacterized protein n=1 Tax=Sedimentibacter saalensis TaxID=130788 RepID=A0A562JKA1_9FIRM|nr:hypothetical protein [Sedimentibacter saalensis]TWH83636.1 hypothetical protein LY60_00248 [Sedimentibacter saalensis]
MKKVISIILVFVFLLAMQTIAIAAPAPKTVDVLLDASSTTIKVGQVVTLTAITDKQGSGYIDSWDEAEKIDTIHDTEAETYVSTAKFTGITPGTYTITYEITMSSGKSDVTFNGVKSVEITVVQDSKIKGAAIYNVKVTPTYNPNGHLTGYDAEGDLYAVWDNGDETYYGKVEFNFSPNQESRNYDVIIEGVTYTVKDIQRPAN